MANNTLVLLARRPFVLGGLLSLLPVAARAAAVIPGAIHQEVNFTVSPDHVYQVLTDEKQFAIMSGAPAKIENIEGGKLSLFGGAIVGRNLELLAGKRLIQAWRDATWFAGLYSIVRFELSATNQGTHLAFDQAGYPESDRSSLMAGWKSHYRDPMRAYFSKA